MSTRIASPDGKFRWMVTGRTASVLIDGTLFQLDKDAATYTKFVEMLRSGHHDKRQLLRWTKPAYALETSTKGLVRMTSKGVLYRGRRIPDGALAESMLRVLDIGEDITPWMKFTEKVMANPLESAKAELFSFLKDQKLPLTLDGDFLAYKKVRSDYTAVHDGTTSYKLGTVTTMPFDKVNQNRDVTCSRGLHFCSKSYLPEFRGHRTIVVKVNPAMVGAIPSDYGNAKGRAAQLENVGELMAPNKGLTIWATRDAAFSQAIPSDYGNAKGRAAQLENVGELMAADTRRTISASASITDGIYNWSKWTEETSYSPDPNGTAAEGMEKEAVVPVTTKNRAVVTKEHGIMTRNKLIKLRREHGSWKGVASHLGMSAGTVAMWVSTAGLVAKPRS